MNKTFNLLFYVKKAKINSVGESPIYLRITIDGKISEISTKRTVKPSKRNVIFQKKTRVFKKKYFCSNDYFN